MKSTMKAVICLSVAGAATAASDPRREVIRFPFNMPRGHKPVGGFNFMANCYNFINTMSLTNGNPHTLPCHADGKLCDAWASSLPAVIEAKHSGAASRNKALSYNHWCDAVRLSKDPHTMPVANFKAENHNQQRKAQHVEHKKVEKKAEHKVEKKAEKKAEQKVEQKAKVQLKAKKVQQQEEAEHVRLARQAQQLREQAEEAKAKAAKAAEEAEDKKSVAEMMKELSARAKREVEERQKKEAARTHKEALVAKAVHEAAAEAPKAAAAPKAQKPIKHHGWDGVLATEDKMDAELKAGGFVQKAASPAHAESRIGHMMEEIYEDVASFVHRVV